MQQFRSSIDHLKSKLIRDIETKENLRDQMKNRQEQEFRQRFAKTQNSWQAKKDLVVGKKDSKLKFLLS